MTIVSTAATAAPAVSSFFATKEDYLAFKARWKALANAKAISVEDVALRVILLGKDPLRALPPTKNADRLANGGWNGSGLVMSMTRLGFEAHHAQRVLGPVQEGRRPAVPTPFANGWAKSGVPFETLATLGDAARHAMRKGAR
jgi:hypothetical protein